LETARDGRVTVVVPHLPIGGANDIEMQRHLVNELLIAADVRDYVLWYYTPMALAFTDHLMPSAIVYDCMDELSAFQGASPSLKVFERQLMQRASLVLTGGRSLFEAKRHLHRNIHPFPSSVDVAHFAQARRIAADPPDQASIAHPRLGFFGVLDERLDVALLDGIARARPDWQLVLVGPTVKIDHASLPRRQNIHYLGAKAYAELPSYIAGWDVALLLFAQNDATRFISPTKTPEYLAAGKPVVSTPIRDVVRPYGDKGLARIAADAPSFIAACEAALREDAGSRLRKSDAFLRRMSWDTTWDEIRGLMDRCVSSTVLRSARQTRQEGQAALAG